MKSAKNIPPQALLSPLPVLRDQRAGLRRRPRGSAYLLVIAITMLVTVITFGILMTTRITSRAAAAENDWEEAGTIAFSACEQAVSVINAQAAANPTGWRSAYTNRQLAVTQSFGRGTMAWALKDEIDGNLADDYSQPVRVYGIGKVNNATRVYSVQLFFSGTALDVLRTSLHSDSTLTAGGTLNGGGPVSTNSSLAGSGTINASVEAALNGSTCAITGSSTIPAATKPMPLPGVFNWYFNKATPIAWTALGTGTISPGLLGPSNNPYGTTNSDGLYSIQVPSGGTLQIQSSRIRGTLVISCLGSANVNFVGPILWEPNRADYPLCIISGSGVTVKFTGSTTWLNESSIGVNVNPSSTPFEGTSDTNTSGQFPPQYRGLIHVIGSSNTVSLTGNFYLKGCLVADCPVTTATTTTVVPDPNLLTQPPQGYVVGDKMIMVPGTWRWDTLP